MSAKALAILGCIVLFATTPFSGIAHEDLSLSDHDATRNHLIEQVGAAVYTVEANFRFYKKDSPKIIRESNGLGTAFGVTKNGLIMTAFHVVEAPRYVGFPPKYDPPSLWKYADGEIAEGAYTLIAKDGTRYIGEIVAINPEEDLAILTIAKTAAEKTFPFVSFETSAPKYDSVVAIGAPFGFSFSVTEGIISNPSRPREDGKKVYVQTNASVHPGSSGGPLLLLRNHRVVGIMVQIYSSGNFGVGIGFAIPASDAIKFLNDTLNDIERERNRTPVTK